MAELARAVPSYSLSMGAEPGDAAAILKELVEHGG